MQILQEENEMSGKYDVIVIGAGPGGYVAAIKAAKLGLKTAIIEERRAGGTCLNRGCIPAKAMIHASSLYREMKEAERFGVSASDVTYDYGKIVAYKEETTDKLVQGVEQLLKANGVDVYEGKGTLLEEKKVRIQKKVEDEEDSTIAESTADDTVIEGKNIILASGSKPLILPIPGMDNERVLTSDALFAMKEAPKSLIIIGGGVISVEFATVYASLECKITILEAMPKLDIHTVFTTLKKCLDGTSADASVTDLAGIHDGIHVFMFFELYAVFFGSIFFLGEMKHDADTDDTADYGGKVTDQYSSSGVSTF